MVAVSNESFDVAMDLVVVAENNLAGCCNLDEAAHGGGILGLVVAERLAAVRVHEAGGLANNDLVVVVRARRPDNLAGVDIMMVWVEVEAEIQASECYGIATPSRNAKARTGNGKDTSG